MIAPRPKRFVKKMTRKGGHVAKTPRGAVRIGASILEYAVVGVLVLILVSLLSLWLLRARESARENLCRSRMVAVSRAITDYVDQQDAYPGFANPPKGAQGVATSWVAESLPYLVERLPPLMSTPDGWEAAKEAAPLGAPPPKRPWSDWKKAQKAPIAMLICPAWDSDKVTAGASSYIASCGYADAPANEEVGDYPANGIFLDLRRAAPLTEKAVQEKDGTQFTILLSENIQSGNWDSVKESETGFVWTERYVPRATKESLNMGPKVLAINRGLRDVAAGYKTARPSSFHPGGVHVAFANTRIAKLASTIDPIVYIRLCSVDDAALKNPWSKQSIGPPIGR